MMKHNALVKFYCNQRKEDHPLKTNCYANHKLQHNVTYFKLMFVNGLHSLLTIICLTANGKQWTAKEKSLSRVHLYVRNLFNMSFVAMV